MIKPRDEGASIGITLVKNKAELMSGLRELQKRFKHIYIEEFIKGKEVTVPVLEKDGIPIPLEVIELNHKAEFYSSAVKERFRGTTKIYIIPARLDKFLYEYVKQVAVLAHNAVGCKNYSRVDMVIDDNQIPQILEINSLPVITTWHTRIKWINFDDLIEQIISNAFQ